MSIRFDKLNNKYNNYKFGIGQNSPEEEVKNKKEVPELEKNETTFRGLKNEEDLLTQNIGNLYGIAITKYSKADNDILNETNEILKQLGYSYKVTSSQVASVTNNVKNVVLPGLKNVEDGTVAAHIMDPNGPFANLFC